MNTKIVSLEIGAMALAENRCWEKVVTRYWGNKASGAQARRLVEPGALHERGGHSAQSASLRAPGFPPHVPAGQGVGDRILSGQNEPAGQRVGAVKQDAGSE